MNKYFLSFIKDYVKKRSYHTYYDSKDLKYEIQDYINSKDEIVGDKDSIVSEIYMLTLTSEYIKSFIDNDGKSTEEVRFYYIPDDMPSKISPSLWQKHNSWLLPVLVSAVISVAGGLLQTYLTDRVKINDTVNVKIVK